MTRRYLIAAALCLCISGVLRADAPQPGKQQPQTFEKQVIVKLEYQLYLPPDYGKETSKKWPLIVFLHGAGERGSDIEKVKVHGPPKLVDQPDNPLGGRFIVVSPQCPTDQWWDVQELNPLLDDVMSRYAVDKDRVYLTGLSMGGFGTWSWAEHNPGRFAAIAPMCGGGDTQLARRLKDIPIWAFHGQVDHVVPYARSKEMVEAAEKAGNPEVKFTLYPDADHDCWTRSYANPELYEWFLKHQKHS